MRALGHERLQHLEERRVDLLQGGAAQGEVLVLHAQRRHLFAVRVQPAEHGEDVGVAHAPGVPPEHVHHARDLRVVGTVEHVEDGVLGGEAGHHLVVHDDQVAHQRLGLLEHVLGGEGREGALGVGVGGRLGGGEIEREIDG